MVFVDRKAKYPGRWTMKKSDGTSEVVTLVRNDEPEIEGTPMNAETLNTLSDVAGADIARQQAEAAREAAAGSATAAFGSASAAEKSKTAAATSESNAAKHEGAAKKYSDEAGAKANTDKTLSIENAPADAKATGDALAKKVGKDVILDEDGNVLFYSKAAVDKLLAGKLDLTGGAMTGELIFGNIAGKIYTGPNDAAYGPEEGLSNLVIESWNGISFAAADSHQVYYKKTAVGIDCRNSVVMAKRFKGVADNGIVASGADYVRFGDGTQICWGETGQIAVRAYSTATATITYPAAFASGYPMEVSLTIAGNSENDNYSKLVLHTTERRTTNCVIYFKSVASGEMNPIAQWLAIGRWK